MTENLDRNPELELVATYRRSIAASVERVWENVLDWEHLPFVHSGSFADIQCNEGGAWGWRAQVRYPGGVHVSNIELITDRKASRYVTRVLDGPGAGGEVWTTVHGVAARKTDIAVDFCMHVAGGVDPDAIGSGYLALYDRLWNEDEQMMQRRQVELDRREAASLDTAARGTVELGTRDTVRAQLPLQVAAFGSRFQIVELDGKWIVHSLVCPHSLGPLDAAPVIDGKIECPWHGYRFDLRTGRSCDGKRFRLEDIVRLEIDEVADRVWLVATAKGESEACAR